MPIQTYWKFYHQKMKIFRQKKSDNRGGSNEYPQSMFWAEMWKISELFICKFSFFGGKMFSLFE